MESGSCGNISPDQTLEIIRHLSPISPLIYGVVEAAQSVVPDCIELFNRRCGEEVRNLDKIHAGLYPSLMRAIMQILLNSKNLKTQVPHERDADALLLKTTDRVLPDWDRLILSNNGLAGRFAGHDYRLLKALKGETLQQKLPPPGRSHKKQNYYCQSHLLQCRMNLFPSDGDDPVETPRYNVIYLWDNSSGNLISLYLCCPKWGNESKAETYFIEPIENPVLSIRPVVEPEDIMQEIDLPRIQEDIGIMLEGDIHNESNPTDLWESN